MEKSCKEKGNMGRVKLINISYLRCARGLRLLFREARRNFNKTLVKAAKANECEKLDAVEIYTQQQPREPEKGKKHSSGF